MKTLKWMAVLFLLALVLAFGGWRLYLKSLPAIEPLPTEIALRWSGLFTDAIANSARGRLDMDYKEGWLRIAFDYANPTDRNLTMLVLRCEVPTENVFLLPRECFAAKEIPPGNFRMELTPTRTEIQKKFYGLRDDIRAEVMVIGDRGEVLGRWSVSMRTP